MIMARLLITIPILFIWLFLWQLDKLWALLSNERRVEHTQAMIRTAAGPDLQTTRPELDTHVSFRIEKIGRSFANQICRHALDEAASEWDMAVPSTNHEDRCILEKFDESQLSCSQHLALTDSSKQKIESNDAFDCFESLESSRVDAEDRHQACLEQRMYRAWLGARGLHIH